MILTLVTALLVVLSSKLLYAVLYGRIVFVVVHWIFVLVVDQVRNFLVQSLIWFLLQRRCGQVPASVSTNQTKNLLCLVILLPVQHELNSCLTKPKPIRFLKNNPELN